MALDNIFFFFCRIKNYIKNIKNCGQTPLYFMNKKIAISLVKGGILQSP